MDQVVEVKGIKLLAAKVDGVDMNGLRDLGDQLKEKLGEGVVVLAAVNGGKVNLLAMATDGAQKAGAHAGNLIKGVAAIVGGGGGGRPNMAQAGGKNPEKAQEAVEAAAVDGPYLSRDDFRQRTKVSKTVIDLMNDLGIFGDLPESNQLSLFDL